MKKSKNRQQQIVRIILMIALALLIAAVFQHVAYAASGGWIDGTDSPIYDGGMTVDRKNSVMEVLNVIWNKIKGLASDLLGALFADMIRSTGDSLYYILSMAGVDLNAIVYGRVGGAAVMNDGIALFTFELVPGNPYGIVAMFIYGSLRMIFVLLMICVLLWRLSTFLYSSANGRERERLKESVTTAVILTLLVVLMPYVLGVVLFLRDVILYVVMVRGGELIETVSNTIYPDFMSVIGKINLNRISSDIMYAFYGAAGKYNLITMFRDAAGGNLVNALMYIGAVIMTLYFAVAYISAALSQVVLIISFPMASVASMFDRSIMKNWLKQLVGTLMIPIIDSLLMIIPVFFGLLGKSQSVSGYTLLQLILCCCIIPARGCVRLWLGFGGSNGIELAGIGALMGAMQLGKAIAGVAIGIGTKNLAAGMAATSDESLADMFTEQQQARQLEEVGTENKLEKDIQEMFGGPEAARTGQDNAGTAETPGMGGVGGSGGLPGLRERVAELDKRKAVLTDQMRKNDVRNAEIARKTATLDEDIATLKAEKEAARAMGPQGQGKVEECDRLISENELTKKRLNLESASIRRENAVKAGQISRLDSVSRWACDAMIGMRAAGGGGAMLPKGEQEVLDRYANIDNFETPEFKNISLERKAELYRERAKVTRKRARLQTVLEASGAVAGATLGVGATMFGSPAVTMYGTALGMQAGAVLGAAAEETYHGRQTMSSYRSVPSVSVSRGSSVADVERIEDGRSLQLRIAQKQTVRQEMIVDKQMEIITDTKEGERSVTFSEGPRDFGDERHQWIYGGVASDERIWYEVISSPTGQERVNTEFRRALTAASSGIRLMRRNLDGDFSRTSQEKNEEILENAMNTFSAEFSFNVLNNGVIPDNAVYDGYDANEYMEFLENKVRNEAAEILKEKLQSLGLLY